MKKTLTAIALMGVFAGAQAADVSFYGIIDYGMYMNHTDVKTAEKNVDYDTVELNSGINAGPLFGLVGEETLGNGYKISFKLENGFNADDGTLGDDNKLFNREAALTVSADWGSLAMGRMGGVGSSFGTYDLTFAIGDAFDGGDSAVFGMVTSYRRDNMVTYQTPKLAGIQATAQYSFKMDNTEDTREGHKDSDRYAGFALTGDFGKLKTVFSYDQDILADTAARDDAKIVSLGGNYDFELFTLYAMGQYFESANRFVPGNIEAAIGGDSTLIVNGEAYHIGAASVLPNGYLQGALYYMDAKLDDKTGDYEYMGATVRYTHNLSKRTSLYVGVGYAETDGKFEANESQAYFGMTHGF